MELFNGEQENIIFAFVSLKYENQYPEIVFSKNINLNELFFND